MALSLGLHKRKSTVSKTWRATILNHMQGRCASQVHYGLSPMLTACRVFSPPGNLGSADKSHAAALPRKINYSGSAAPEREFRHKSLTQMSSGSDIHNEVGKSIRNTLISIQFCLYVKHVRHTMQMSFPNQKYSFKTPSPCFSQRQYPLCPRSPCQSLPSLPRRETHTKL
jgi:hypothetical protein